uniref:FBD domain-containing protein n=1 Tax=Cucumis melo TaxID=3656 RepID=A0A1S3C2V5_CUCME
MTIETRSARRRRLSITNSDLHNETGVGVGVDYISHLPDALLHHILSSLPIKTAAQSATLSSRWRSLWFTLPDLDFSTASSISDLIITRILNSRPHHSNVRLLRFSSSLTFSRLNALFRTAIRHRIQQLHLHVATNDYFNLPRCVISSDSLRVFNLRSTHPGFRLPPPSVMIVSSPTYFARYFPPLNNVNCLELSTALRKQNGPGLANIFRSCSVLHTLTIKIVDGGNIGRKDWRRDKWERSASEEEQFWETQIEPLKSFLLHLKIVKIEGFMDCLSEVSLTQFLLKHGSALQQLTLLTTKTKHRDSPIRRREIKSQIMAFPRASSLVKLYYC